MRHEKSWKEKRRPEGKRKRAFALKKTHVDEWRKRELESETRKKLGLEASKKPEDAWKRKPGFARTRRPSSDWRPKHSERLQKSWRGNERRLKSFASSLKRKP